MAQYLHLANPDHEWLTVSPHIRDLDFTNLVAMRQLIEQKALSACSPTQAEPKGLSIAETMLPVTNDANALRTYVPTPNRELQEDESTKYPILVWVYGGGWCGGEIDDSDRLLRSIAVELRVSCVCADYRKAPENPYPIPLDDAYASLRWAVENMNTISADISKGLIIGGISAGGNLAAAMAHRAMKDPQLTGKVTGVSLVIAALLAPSEHDRFKGELLSMDQNANADILTSAAMRKCWDAYHGLHDASNPEVSPILASPFGGLPPTYFQINGIDPLRDESFLYDRLLREAGVAPKSTYILEFPMGFMCLHRNWRLPVGRTGNLRKDLYGCWDGGRSWYNS
ncbi:alpha/beta hydrolase fold-domain-containing protein [Hysterangium stoloniferum]|nr:alpha/beta hydrolase fold-domain-containing protein [Hysterangium stoloniferum]